VAKSGDGYAAWEDAGSGARQPGVAHADPAAVIAAVPTGNGFHCSARAALADPDGEEGRALKDSLDSGDYGKVVRGSW
jgi:hypothetical protein